MSEEPVVVNQIPFVVTTERGGVYEPSAYQAGFELGVLFMTLGDEIPPKEYEQEILLPNVKQADLIAMYHGYRTQTVGQGDGKRVTMRFTKTSMSLSLGETQAGSN